MLKLIICEFRKLKRKKLFYAAFLTTFIMPVLYAVILRDGSTLDNMMSTVREENGFILLIPLSVILAANLFFGEHDDDTLKNLLCVPVTKGRLASVKLTVLLLFDVGYILAGYAAAFLLAVLTGHSPVGWQQQLFLTFGTGILLWAAALPCMFLVVWFNRSYIISVIIAFAYAILGYCLHVSDAVVMAPLGCNIQTFLPVPVIFRWLYQYHPTEGMGGETLEFYQRFSPYFIKTPIVFAILAVEAVVSIALIVWVYQRQEM